MCAVCILTLTGLAQSRYRSGTGNIGPPKVGTAEGRISSFGETKLPLRVYGDGRACNGEFRLTATTLYWKSSFITCRSTNWSGFKDGDGWTLTLPKDPTGAMHCPIRAIRIEAVEGDTSKHAVWSISGFKSLDAVHRTPYEGILGCVMN